MDALSIDQFAVFAAIVEEGSFIGAARRLNRAQSAITYAIRKLEDQGGVQLFDRSAYRPTLSEAGRSLLPYARRVLSDVGLYREQARALASGLEAEIGLVLPVTTPELLLTRALRTFVAVYPSVRLRIAREPNTAALERLGRGAAELVIALNLPDLPDWFDRQTCGALELVAVAAPSHPLATFVGPLSDKLLSDHLQIVVVQRESPDLTPDRGVVAINRWDVTDHGTKHDLLRAGIGWGSMPIHLVKEDLVAGRLVRLEPDMWEGSRQMPTIAQVIGHHHNRPLGLAARALKQAFLESDAQTASSPPHR